MKEADGKQGQLKKQEEMSEVPEGQLSIYCKRKMLWW